jgi:hypothetical protein
MASSSTQRILHQPLLGDEVHHTQEAGEGYDCPIEADNEEGEVSCFGKEARDTFLCWFLLPAFFFSQIALVYFLHENDVDNLYWPLVYFDVLVFLATAWLCRCSIIIDDGLQGMDIFWLFLPEILTDLTTLLVLFDRFHLAYVSLAATIVVFAMLAVQALIRIFCVRFSNDGPEEYTSIDPTEVNDDTEDCPSRDPAEEAREIVNLLII